MPTEERRQRLRLLAAATAEAGLVRLVVLHHGRDTLLAPNPFVTLLGLRPRLPAALVLEGEAPPWLALSDGDEVAAGSSTGVDRGGSYGELAARLPGLLSQRDTGVVGLDAMPAEALPEMTEVRAVAWDRAFWTLFRTKCVEEQDALRRATDIARAALSVLAEVRPGMREFELAALLDHAVKSRGADDVFLLLAGGPAHRAIRPPGDRALAAGDVVLLELSPSVDGHFTQLCRTVTLGRPVPAMRQAYDLLREAFAAGLAAVRPGATVADVVAAVDGPLMARGLGVYCRPPYMRARGHGLGLGPTAPQDLAFDNADALVADMAFVLHPNQFVPEVGYLMCGDPVIVREDGACPLVPALPDLVVLDL
jgi:Xaa-Pro dipeptidase